MPFRGFVADCSLCSTTRSVCFWRAARRYTRQKRTLLSLVSAALLFFVVVPWYASGAVPAWLLVVTSVVVGPLAVLGLAATYVGCDRCVVRLLGEL